MPTQYDGVFDLDAQTKQGDVQNPDLDPNLVQLAQAKTALSPTGSATDAVAAIPAPPPLPAQTPLPTQTATTQPTAPTTDGTPAAGQHWGASPDIPGAVTPILDDPWGGQQTTTKVAGTQEMGNWKNGGDFAAGLADYNALQTSTDPNAQRIREAQFLNMGGTQSQLAFDKRREAEFPNEVLVPGSPHWNDYLAANPSAMTGGTSAGERQRLVTGEIVGPSGAPLSAGATKPAAATASATPSMPTTPTATPMQTPGPTSAPRPAPTSPAQISPSPANPLSGIVNPSATSLAPPTSPTSTPPFTSKDVGIASTVLPNPSARLSGLQSMVDQATSGVAGVDRNKLALDQWQQFAEGTNPEYQAALRSATQRAAGAGRIGSGMLRTDYGNLANQRAQQLDLAKRGYMSDALKGSIEDQFRKAGLLSGLEGQLFGQEQSQRGELRGERGYQGSLEEQAYQRALDQYMMERQAVQDRWQRGLQSLSVGESGNPADYLGRMAEQWGGLDPAMIAILAQSLGQRGGSTGGANTGALNLPQLNIPNIDLSALLKNLGGGTAAPPTYTNE